MLVHAKTKVFTTYQNLPNDVIAKQHGVIHLALFGSYARGEARSDSDVDLYARFGRPVSLFEMLRLQHEMEDAFDLSLTLNHRQKYPWGWCTRWNWDRRQGRRWRLNHKLDLY
jgi:predicted nucleotidyltransferase